MTNTSSQATVKVTAVAVLSSQAYTDCRIAEVRAEIQKFRADAIRAEHRAMQLKITVHVTLLAVGIVVAYMVSPYLLPVVSGVPSLLIEGIDRVLRIV
jgi:hypothetical protein